MARHVTISCVTAPALPLGSDISIDQAIDLEIEHWEKLISTVLPEEPDLIVLPEAADRPLVTTFGAHRQRDYFIQRGTTVRSSLSSIASKHGVNIAYSAQQINETMSYNRTEYIDRDGNTVGAYNKNHLVPAEHDDVGLEYGSQISIIDLDFGRVGTIICFDLNFEELLAQYRGQGIELMVFSSEYHGSFMQNYWAYSLRSYLAGAIRPPAPSSIVSPLGETIAEGTNYFPSVTTTINLDYKVVHLDNHWKKLQAIKDKYGRGIKIHDPGRLGSVLISAESAEIDTAEILDEFDIQTLDEYLAYSRNHRAKNILL